MSKSIEPRSFATVGLLIVIALPFLGGCKAEGERLNSLLVVEECDVQTLLKTSERYKDRKVSVVGRLYSLNDQKTAKALVFLCGNNRWPIHPDAQNDIQVEGNRALQGQLEIIASDPSASSRCVDITGYPYKEPFDARCVIRCSQITRLTERQLADRLKKCSKGRSLPLLAN